MNLLVIGSGGREHAIAKSLKSDAKKPTVYCCPGNIGMIKDGIQLVDLDMNSFEAIIEFVHKNQIDWTFVGPEQPLLDGIVDCFEKEGLKIFGPNKLAAMIEGSKSFAKEIMVGANVPTAHYEVFTDKYQALQYLKTSAYPVVIKADGLAAGKGVVIPNSPEEAFQVIHDMRDAKVFGDSGSKVVIEEFLTGEEFSLLAFVDGKNVYPMIPAQDHKRAFENDLGPNTGGMGAYAPVPQINQDVINKSVTSVLQPVVDYMFDKGIPYSGILYAGLILTIEGPKVIEFNARFGDPEAQVILPLLETSLVEIITDLLDHQPPKIKWLDKVSLGVVVARSGYPTEKLIEAKLPDLSNLKKSEILFSGVKEKKQDLFSTGGRVFLAQSVSDTFEEAKDQIYQELATLKTDDFFYRTDIGYKIQ